MKNRAINTLNYTGIVTLSQYVGDKTIQIDRIQNAGGSALFDFLYDCLMGEFDRSKRPTKIMILTRQPVDDAGVYGYVPASGFIFLRTVPTKDIEKDSNGGVKYSFVIPRDIFENLGATDTLYLGLYSHKTAWEDTNDYMAICKLEQSSSELQNSSLVVDWELFITNSNSSARKTAN